MKKVFLILMVAIVATGQGVNAQESTKRCAADPAAVTSPLGRGDDKRAIQALLDKFVKAFNAANAEATAATYAETAIVVDERGERIEGRAAVRDQYAASFADNPRSTIAIQVDALRFLGPETALEEGRTTITPAAGAGAPEITRFTAIYVKQGGQWLQSAVRDEFAQDLTAPRPPQGTGVARGRLGQREPGRGRLSPPASGPKAATSWTASSP